MSKITPLNDLTSLANETSAVNTINTNNSRIETAFDNTLSLDGSSPNSMTANIDMNGYRITNHPAPVDDNDLATYGTISDFIDDAETSATSATVSAAAAASSETAAAASAASASTSATSAAASAAKLSGTSTTSVLIATGSKAFTTQASKFFDVGNFLMIASAANSANYMHGQVTAYSGTSLTVNVTNVGGSGTLADWNITLSGTRGATGATGAQGAAGAGTGDMLAANNLSDVASASTSRTNLGLGSIATQASSGVSITGGSVTGITDIAVADGGTGASTAAGARTNLGLGTSAVLDVGTTASKVVQLDGSAKLPAVDGSQLTNIPAASAALTQISTSTPGAVSSVQFNSIPQTYRYLVLYWTGVSCATTTRAFQIQIDTVNDTFTTATSSTSGHMVSSAAAVTAYSGSTELFTAVNQTSAQTADGMCTFFNYQTGVPTNFSGYQANGSGAAYGQFSGQTMSAATIDTGAVKSMNFKWSGSGNFDAGTITLYGVS